RSLVPNMDSPDARIVALVGRLKADQSLAQGRAAVDAVDRRLARLEGDTRYAGVQEFSGVNVSSGKAGRTIGAFFALLSLVSLLVLLIACGNVAGLLIARGTTRRREIAIMQVINGITLPIPLPVELHLAPDVSILLAALALVLLSTLFCALLPALK